MTQYYQTTAGITQHILTKIRTILNLYLDKEIDSYNQDYAPSDTRYQVKKPSKIYVGENTLQLQQVSSYISSAPAISVYIRNSTNLGYDISIARDEEFAIVVGVYEQLNQSTPEYTSLRCQLLRDVVSSTLEKYLRDPTGITADDKSIGIYDVSVKNSNLSSPTNIGNNFWIVSSQSELSLFARITYQTKQIWLDTNQLKDIPFVPSLYRPISISGTLSVSGSGTSQFTIEPGSYYQLPILSSDINNIEYITFDVDPNIPDTSRVFINYTNTNSSQIESVLSSSFTILSSSLTGNISPDQYINIIIRNSGSNVQGYYTLEFDIQ